MCNRFYGHESGTVFRLATKTEVLLLGLTMFTLPLFEAPKNVFSILFLAVWFINAIRSKSLGQRCSFEMPIFLLALVLWIGPLVSEYRDTITPLNSAPRWTLLAIFVVLAARLNYSRSQLLLIWAALLLGGACAVSESLWVWHLNGKQYPEFRSVGHVNHSAMYGMVILGAALPAIFVKTRIFSLVGVLATFSVFVYLPPSKSGVALITTIAISTSFALVYAYSRVGWKYLILSSVLSVAILLGFFSLLGGGLWEEFTQRLASENPTNGRLQYAQIAWQVFDRNPVFGTGWFSFSMATAENVLREEVARSGRLVDFGYAGHPHGHNLWTTMLVERGLVGVTSVTVLLFLYFWVFLQIAVSRERLDPVDRGAPVGALLVAVGFAVAGLGNTTMMNEHGQAGMAFIAVAYGYLRGTGITQSSQRQSQ